MFDFGTGLCNVIQMFVNDINSSVSLSHGFSARFAIKRGVRQGGPISPPLFVLAVELVEIYLKNSSNTQGIKILGKDFMLS